MFLDAAPSSARLTMTRGDAKSQEYAIQKVARKELEP